MIFFTSKSTAVLAPCDGKLIKIEQVADPVFANKMIGSGFAIIPTSNRFFAPVSGMLVNVMKTGHAFGLRTTKFELLLHIGLNTVELQGVGFQILVHQGQKVKAKTPLVDVDWTKIKAQKPDLKTDVPVVFVAKSMVNRQIKMLAKYDHQVRAGDVICYVK